MLYLFCCRDGVITTAEFFNYMKGKEGCPKATKMKKISEILDEDHDGKIRVADLNKVYGTLRFGLQYVNCAECARMKAIYLKTSFTMCDMIRRGELWRGYGMEIYLSFTI